MMKGLLYESCVTSLCKGNGSEQKKFLSSWCPRLESIPEHPDIEVTIPTNSSVIILLIFGNCFKSLSF